MYATEFQTALRIPQRSVNIEANMRSSGIQRELHLTFEIPVLAPLAFLQTG